MSQPQLSYRLILLPSFVGLVCWACSSTPKEIVVNLDEDTAAQAVARPIDPSVDASVNPSVAPSVDASASQPGASSPSAASSQASAAAYREGVNLASSAYQLSQSAVSPDDWTLIASRWQRAANRLEQVSAGDEHYEAAQQKIAEYNRSADHANARIAALQQSTYRPVTVARRPTTAPNTSAPTARQALPSSTSRQPTGQVTVPVARRLHGTPVVRVTFNGIRTYEMILDTGASRTLITRRMANELGIVATERMIAATASESEVSFDLGRMEAISLGNITLNDARVGIGDSVDIGLLGNDFLRGYDVTIRADVVELVPAR